jgi:hypothetical protein
LVAGRAEWLVTSDQRQVVRFSGGNKGAGGSNASQSFASTSSIHSPRTCALATSMTYGMPRLAGRAIEWMHEPSCRTVYDASATTTRRSRCRHSAPRYCVVSVRMLTAQVRRRARALLWRGITTEPRHAPCPHPNTHRSDGVRPACANEAIDATAGAGIAVRKLIPAARASDHARCRKTA